MHIVIREMTMQDYDQARYLWENTQHIGISNADSRENIALFLLRNPGMNFVACDNDRLVGTVLCGHDGRRGYLYHMAVEDTHRYLGIARQLGEKCLVMLEKAGIEKCHIFVYAGNEEGKLFWKKTGWVERNDLIIMSYSIVNK